MQARKSRFSKAGLSSALLLVLLPARLAHSANDQPFGQGAGWPCLSNTDCQDGNCACPAGGCAVATPGTCCESGHTGTLPIGGTCTTANTFDNCCLGFCSLDGTGAKTCQYPGIPTTSCTPNDDITACTSDSACCSEHCQPPFGGSRYCCVPETTQCRTGSNWANNGYQFNDCCNGNCVPDPLPYTSTSPSPTSMGYNGNCCFSSYPQTTETSCTCDQDCVSGNCDLDAGGICAQAKRGWAPYAAPCTSDSDCAIGFCDPNCLLSDSGYGKLCNVVTDCFGPLHGVACSEFNDQTYCDGGAVNCSSEVCGTDQKCCSPPGQFCRSTLDCCGHSQGVQCYTSNSWVVPGLAGSGSTYGVCLITTDAGFACTNQSDCHGYGVDSNGISSPPAQGSVVCEMPPGWDAGTCTILQCATSRDCFFSGKIDTACEFGNCCGGLNYPCNTPPLFPAGCCASSIGGWALTCGTSGGRNACCVMPDAGANNLCKNFSDCCGWQGGANQMFYCHPQTGACASCLGLGSTPTGVDAGQKCCSESNADGKCCAPLKSAVPWNAASTAYCAATSDCCDHATGAICDNNICCLTEGLGNCTDNVDCCDGYCVQSTHKCAKLPDPGPSHGPCTAN
jgi:hypothetical protein